MRQLLVIASLCLLTVSSLLAENPKTPLLDAPGPGYRGQRGGVDAPRTVTDDMAKELPVFTLSAGDITKALIQMDLEGRNALVVTFTPRKRAEFTKFTNDNIGRRVRLVICGRIVSEPRIQGVIAGWTLEYIFPSPEDALKAARELLKRDSSATQPGKQ